MVPWHFIEEAGQHFFHSCHAQVTVPGAPHKVRNAPPVSPILRLSMSRTPFPTIDRAEDAKAPMHLVHMDLCRPLPKPSVGGCIYMATFIDDTTSSRS